PYNVGSWVRLVGVLVPGSGAGASATGYQLQLTSPDAISVLRNPPWWTPQRLILAMSVLIVPIGLGVLWVRVLRRRVREQTDQIKRQMERENKLHDHLHRANRLESLGLLAGGIAHDFNNLLTVVLGNLSLLRFDIPADTEAEQNLSEAESAVQRAKRLTMQLLTFSKGGSPVRSAEDLPG